MVGRLISLLLVMHVPSFDQVDAQVISAPSVSLVLLPGRCVRHDMEERTNACESSFGQNMEANHRSCGTRLSMRSLPEYHASGNKYMSNSQ